MSDREPDASKNEFQVDTLPIQEKVLLHAMRKVYKTTELTGSFNRATIDYVIQDANRIHSVDLTQKELEETVNDFRNEPKRALAVGRNNMLAILADPSGGTSTVREERLDRYLTSFESVIEKLDHAAFPPQKDPNQVQFGVPEYIPDGLSDMGKDPRIDPSVRTREKIRVDKKGVFAQEKTFLRGLFKELSDSGYGESDDPKKLEAMKFMIVSKICNHVFSTVKYDFDLKVRPEAINGSVGISKYVDEGVCRHIAMRAQLLFQTMGITSKLFKCEFDGVPHAANLVRINKDWYIIDPTNPLWFDQKQNKYIFGASQSKITLEDVKAKRTVHFEIPMSDGTKVSRKYKPVDTMYYRILKN